MLLEERAEGKVTQKERSQKAVRATGPGKSEPQDGGSKAMSESLRPGQTPSPWILRALSSSPSIIVMTVLAPYCCVTDRPKTQWLETRFIYFASEFAVWAELRGDCCVCFMMPGASA